MFETLMPILGFSNFHKMNISTYRRHQTEQMMSGAWTGIGKILGWQEKHIKITMVLSRELHYV